MQKTVKAINKHSNRMNISIDTMIIIEFCESNIVLLALECLDGVGVGCLDGDIDEYKFGLIVGLFDGFITREVVKN